MKAVRISSVVSLALAALAVCVTARAAETQRAQSAPMSMAIVPLADVRPLLRAADLQYMPIRNLDSTLNGHVADLVLSEDHKTVEYAAVAFHESAGRLYKVPFQHLRTTADGATLICDFTTDRMPTLMSFPADAWAPGKEPRRVNRLLGMRVRDVAGEPAGRIRDLLIESSTGIVREATVGVGGFLGFSEDLASLEWSSVTLGPEQATLDISAEKLAERSYPREAYWQRLGFAGEKESRDVPEVPQTGYPLTPLNPNY
jgi:sporulation protein YlmC with PRC-barrel domain